MNSPRAKPWTAVAKRSGDTAFGRRRNEQGSQGPFDSADQPAALLLAAARTLRAAFGRLSRSSRFRHAATFSRGRVLTRRYNEGRSVFTQRRRCRRFALPPQSKASPADLVIPRSSRRTEA